MRDTAINQYYIDYIDEDLSYLLGLIVARGTIEYMNGVIEIVFPYRYLEIDNVSVWPSIVSSIATRIERRLQELGFETELQASKESRNIILKLSTKPSSIIMRVLKMHLMGRTNYREFTVPRIILELAEKKEKGYFNIVTEFLRGYCDVAAHIRKSNADPKKFHRVYVDVLFSNWRLPVQLCKLFRSLDVRPHTITWGHPNLRDPKALKGPSFWKKEHQIKIYAHDFLKIGFTIIHKQQLLKEYARENENRLHSGEKPYFKPCNGRVRRRKRVPEHPGENDVELPTEIRGKHFNHFTEICRAMGCELANGRYPTFLKFLR